MNFVDDENINVENKKMKKDKLPFVAAGLGVAILVVLVLIAFTYSALTKMKGKELTLSLNGELNNNFKKLLVIEDNGDTYVPIRDVADYFGYKSYNGNYINKSESTDECYIESKNEIVTFVVDSDEIEKINPSTSDITYFTIEKPIKKVNDKLYIEMDGLQIAYNLNASYKESQNRIVLETMDYIIEQNKTDILGQGFKAISEKFDDKKAILKGLAIVTNESNKYGLYNINTKETILETKYDNIEYVPITQDFTIKSNGNVGIKDSTGRDKIQTRYESIEFVGQKFKLYVVKKDNKYGIIDNNEAPIIPIKYDRIGIDMSSFAKNNIKNKYVLANKAIPVKQNNSWALFDTNGVALTDFVYSGMGCTSSSGNSLIVIPDYNVIVVAKDKKYILITNDGKEVWGGRTFEQAYLQYQNGIPSYYIVTNNRTYDAVKILEKTLGVDTTQTQTEEETTSSENTSNTEQEESNSRATNSTNTNRESTISNNRSRTDASSNNNEEENNNQNEEEQNDDEQNEEEQNQEEQHEEENDEEE